MSEEHKITNLKKLVEELESIPKVRTTACFHTYKPDGKSELNPIAVVMAIDFDKLNTIFKAVEKGSAELWSKGAKAESTSLYATIKSFLPKCTGNHFIQGEFVYKGYGWKEELSDFEVLDSGFSTLGVFNEPKMKELIEDMLDRVGEADWHLTKQYKDTADRELMWELETAVACVNPGVLWEVQQVAYARLKELKYSDLLNTYETWELRRKVLRAIKEIISAGIPNGERVNVEGVIYINDRGVLHRLN